MDRCPQVSSDDRPRRKIRAQDGSGDRGAAVAPQRGRGARAVGNGAEMTARRVKQWRSALFLYGGLAAHLTGVVAFYTRIAAHIGTSDGWFMVGAIGAAGMLIACVETLYRENGTIRRNRRELTIHGVLCALCKPCGRPDRPGTGLSDCLLCHFWVRLLIHHPQVSRCVNAG